jgi:hypothetical protein
MTHQSDLPPPETEPSPDVKPIGDVLDELFTELRFTIPPELIEARHAVLLALLETTDDPMRRQTAWVEYDIVVEGIVDNLETTPQNIEQRAKMHTAMILYKALIFQEVTLSGRYIEELDNAHTYSFSNGPQTVIASIKTELETIARQDTDLSPEILLVMLKGEVSELYRESLRDRLAGGDSLEVIMTDTYYTLQNKGKDLQEVLAKLKVQPPLCV